MERGLQTLTPEEHARWTRVGMLAALAMALSYLETFIPIPIPGVKLGLANIAVLIALAQRDVPGAFCVGAIKVLATGLLFGNPVMMAYSALGTLLAFGVMAPLSRVRGLSVALVSMAGALAHEVGQLLVAQVLLGTPLVWYSAPLLAVAGCITGGICGVVASRAMARTAPGPAPETPEPAAPAETALRARRSSPRVKVNPKALVVAFIAFAVIVLHLSTPPALACAIALAVVACFLGRVEAAAVARAAVPTIAILAITVVAQIASNQYGDVVFSMGTVDVTAQALTQSGIMVARFLGIMAASVAVMYLAGIDDLVEAVGWLLSPLERIGVRTAGFTLALNVALSTVPAAIAAARQREWNWRSLWDTIPSLIAQIYKGTGTE